MELELPADRAALLSPVPCPVTGATREGLHSMLRRVCEKNQLSVNDVLGELILPALGERMERRTKMATAVHLIDRGCGISQRLAMRLEELTTFQELYRLTLRELVELKGVATLAVASQRKWCGNCFSEDMATEFGPYDRLIWSIDGVDVCPVHHVWLRSNCSSCGGGPFSVLMGKDASGRCPKCGQLLAGDGVPLDAGRDEYSKFLLWKAKSFADLLSSPLPSGVDVAKGATEVIRHLSEWHFEGTYSRFAKAIERNRSVIGTWLTGRAAPSWDALVEISYVFQVPLLELLVGDTDGVKLSSLRRLPIGAARRLSCPRKRPVRRQPNTYKAVLARIESGDIPNLVTMKAVAAWLGMHERELSRILPEDYARVSRILAARRGEQRANALLARRRLLEEEVPAAVAKLARQGLRPTRRALDHELRLRGIAVRRGEAPLIRTVAQKALTLAPRLSVSGN